MSGSGSREGFGLPPWDPADPVPELDDTQALPGLGSPRARMTQGTGPDAGPEPEPGAGGGAGTSGAQGTDENAARDGGQPADGQPDEPGEPGEPAGKRRRRRRSLLRELPVLIVVALVLALVIKTYAIQAFWIPSSSMEKTLEVGDRVLINKLVYDFRPIHRGDIVVFDGTGSWDPNQVTGSPNLVSRFVGDIEGIVGISHNADIYIKRVIGIPGDHVACCDAQGRVTVNGIALNEKSYVYPGEAPSLDRFNITVPPGRLWVMGDHRTVSYDSRGHMGDPGGGTIPESAVLGRAFVIIWPPSQWSFLNIPATFEQPKLNASAAAAGGSSKALAAAMASGTPLQSSASGLPLALGFACAVPLTWLQAITRRKVRARRSRRKA